MQKYLKMTFDGSTFPDDPYRRVKVTMDKHILDEYLPAFDRVLPDAPLGRKLLLSVMADAEGFRPGSKSYRTNNPGNIGNTDDGSTRAYKTLDEGILAQSEKIDRIIAGKSKAYPMGKSVYLQPGHSQEMERNKKTYGVTSGYYPGYRFVFTGQIDQYVKIYATLARVSNLYVNTIVSWFHKNGFTQVTPESKIQDLVKLTQADWVKQEGLKRIDTPNGGGVNVRSGPGTSFKVVMTIPENSYVKVIAESDDWSQTEEGWIKSEFLK